MRSCCAEWDNLFRTCTGRVPILSTMMALTKAGRSSRHWRDRWSPRRAGPARPISHADGEYEPQPGDAGHARARRWRDRRGSGAVARAATNRSLPFDSYAGFLMAHPGWPGETGNRRAAEKQAANFTAAPSSIVAYFRRFPPQSAAGGVAYARALLATGAPAEAAQAARTAWRRGALSRTTKPWSCPPSAPR